MTRPATTVLLVGLLLAAAGIAQGPTSRPTSQPQQPAQQEPGKGSQKGKQAPKGEANPEREAKEKRIRAEIERMRRQIREGALVHSHVRVTVRLKNGNRIRGIVKDGRLVEKLDGLRFVEAERGTKGAGIRIYHFDDTGSYIFLPFESLVRYDVGERLSAEQLAEIEARVRQANEVAKQRYEQIQQQRAQAAESEGQQQVAEGQQRAAADKAKAEAQVSAEEQRLLALVEEFPPKDGWSKERKDQIELRKVTVGAFPAGKEKRFLEVFSDWQKGVELAAKKAAEAKDAQQGKPATGTQPPTDPQPTPPGGADTPAPGNPAPGTPAPGAPPPVGTGG